MPGLQGAMPPARASQGFASPSEPSGKGANQAGVSCQEGARRCHPPHRYCIGSSSLLHGCAKSGGVVKQRQMAASFLFRTHESQLIHWDPW